MIFNSVPFLIFIVIFIPVFYLLKGNYRLAFVLLASYFFYGWWDWRFLGLLGFSTLMDYTIGRGLENEENEQKRQRLLYISVVVNLTVLAFFKYFNFFLDSVNGTLQQFDLPVLTKTLGIILPVGISFYTFQSLSYTIDVYRRKILPEHSLLRFAAFIAFFPQLVAGPIVRAEKVLPQFYETEKKPNINNFISGLDLVFVGFLKKVVIADSLALVVDGTFSAPGDYSTIHLIISIIFYSFQIYCDFSGYTDIAIGIARMLGYEFPENFNIPYIASSFSDFWSRWHISLSTWLRDYLYIPLGGNRKGTLLTYRNLMITMLLGGLWHGASWTFIFWGFLHGMYLIGQRLLNGFYTRFDLYPKKQIPKFIFRLSSIVFVYIAVCYAWIYFRSADFATASTYVKGILAFDNLSMSSLVSKFLVAKGAALIIILFLFELISTKVNYQQAFEKLPLLRIGFYALVIWSISLFGAFSENQFIYFQF